MNYKKEIINEKEKEIKEQLDKALQKGGFFVIKTKNEDEIFGKQYEIAYYEGDIYILIMALDKSTYTIINAKNILYIL